MPGESEEASVAGVAQTRWGMLGNQVREIRGFYQALGRGVTFGCPTGEG